MSPVLKAVLWGLGVGLYLHFGLEPTGWFFYELSQSSGLAWLHWGYSIFRGAGYAFGLWAYQTLACFLIGGLVFLIVNRRKH